MRNTLTKICAVLCAVSLVLTLSACKKKSNKKPSSKNPSSSTSQTASPSDKSSSGASGSAGSSESEYTASQIEAMEKAAGTTTGKTVKKFLGNWKMSDLTIKWSKSATKEQKKTQREAFEATYGKGLSDDEYLKKYAAEFDKVVDTAPVYIIKDGGKGEMRFGKDGSATSSEIWWVVKGNKLVTNDETSFEFKGKNLVSVADSDGLVMTATFVSVENAPALAK